MLAPYNDTGRRKVKQAAEITGYVFDVKVGVIESTNCHASGVEQRDTHIELVLDPMAGSPTQRVIVEVTPRWRAIVGAQGVDWSTRTLRDRLLGHNHFGVSTRCDGSPDPDIVLNGVVGYQCLWKKKCIPALDALLSDAGRGRIVVVMQWSSRRDKDAT